MTKAIKLRKYRNIVDVIELEHIATDLEKFKEFKIKNQVICVLKDDFEGMMDEMLELFNDHFELQKQNIELLLLINESNPELLKKFIK